MPKSKQGLVWKFLEKEKARELAANGPVTVGTWTVGNSSTVTINGTGTAMRDWRDYITTATTNTTPTISIEWTDSGLIGSVVYDAK